jgi:hypothetical protein
MLLYKGLVALHCVRTYNRRVAILFRAVTIQNIPLKSTQVTKYSPSTNHKLENGPVFCSRLTAPNITSFHACRTFPFVSFSVMVGATQLVRDDNELDRTAQGENSPLLFLPCVVKWFKSRKTM